MTSTTSLLASRLRELIGSDAMGWIELPLLAGVRAGDLDTAVFRNYLEQDYLYLRYYARIYSRLAGSAQDEQQVEHFIRLAHGVLEVELEHHRRISAPFGCDFEAARPSSVTQDYLDFYDDLSGDRAGTLVAMTPCLYGYGVALAPLKGRGAGPYVEWLSVYSGVDYAAMIDAHFAAIDALDISEDRALALTSQALELERRFWNQLPEIGGA